jgi:hypothetical protein
MLEFTLVRRRDHGSKKKRENKRTRRIKEQATELNVAYL